MQSHTLKMEEIKSSLFNEKNKDESDLEDSYIEDLNLNNKSSK